MIEKITDYDVLKQYYLPLVMKYMNQSPANTIKARTYKPILPLRLSWRITQINNPVNGIKKTKKKIILAALIIYIGSKSRVLYFIVRINN